MGFLESDVHRPVTGGHLAAVGWIAVVSGIVAQVGVVGQLGRQDDLFIRQEGDFVGDPMVTVAIRPMFFQKSDEVLIVPVVELTGRTHLRGKSRLALPEGQKGSQQIEPQDQS